MPYKHTSYKIKPEHDKRIKLTKQQREDIYALYQTGSCSQRYLAREYGVSRRLIQFIIDPDKLIANKARRDERGGSKIYYDREKHTEAMRTHRQYKQMLYLAGKLE